MWQESYLYSRIIGKPLFEFIDFTALAQNFTRAWSLDTRAIFSKPGRACRESIKPTLTGDRKPVLVAFICWLSEHITSFDGHCFVAHSPDNSFLGFAVPQRKQKDKDENTRKAALVYGKDPAFWKVTPRSREKTKTMILKWFNLYCRIYQYTIAREQRVVFKDIRRLFNRNNDIALGRLRSVRPLTENLNWVLKTKSCLNQKRNFLTTNTEKNKNEKTVTCCKGLWS